MNPNLNNNNIDSVLRRTIASLLRVNNNLFQVNNDVMAQNVRLQQDNTNLAHQNNVLRQDNANLRRNLVQEYATITIKIEGIEVTKGCHCSCNIF